MTDTEQQPRLMDKTGPFIPTNSDGCTAVSWPYNKLTGKKLPFRHCCVTHDESYWYGGTSQERRDADLLLMNCVYSHRDVSSKLSTIFWWAQSRSMYLAVRIGGSPRLPTPWRWQLSNSYTIRNIIRPYAKCTD